MPGRLLKKPLLTIAIFLSSTLITKAQGLFDNNGSLEYSVQLSLAYDNPLGDLSYTFKGTPVYSLSFVHYTENLIGSVTVGYHSYKPKQSIFYYLTDDNSYGTINWQPFTGYEIYLGGAYKVDLSDGLLVYAGLNLGAYYTHYAYQSNDNFANSSTDLHEQQLYVAPKLGLNFMLTENLELGFEGKYNIFAPTGRTQTNSRVGTVYNSYAAGITLGYRF